MRDEVLTFTDEILHAYRGPIGKVLDVGSFDVNGSVRPLFEKRGWKYIGCDVAAGKNVDVVVEATKLHEFFTDTFECVISCESLEHMNDPIRAVDSMRQVLKPGGLLILSAAGNGFPEHHHPIDCWRLMPQGMEYLLRGYSSITVKTVAQTGPPGIMGFGFKP